jgi:hypothetical protein
VKLQVEAPLRELQQLQDSFSFRRFQKIEANFDGWCEATLEAVMKLHFVANFERPYRSLEMHSMGGIGNVYIFI